MLNLSEDDKQFYSAESNWQGGPIFELTMSLAPEARAEEVYRFLLDRFSLLEWDKVFAESTLVRSIMPVTEDAHVGVAHYGYTSKKEPSYLHYDVGIRPSQMERLLGEFPIPGSKWRILNKATFKVLLELFIEIARAVHREFPLEYATINDETYAKIKGCSNLAQGIFIDEYFGPIIGESCKPLGGTIQLSYLPWKKQDSN
ncbi:MAG: hypothetical protein H6677_12845 [Candidatus Obscuribacterales bacterium]|nr:hypothetical protein [Cyanobacteria bacterium HKST-UBA01]MCB9469154.1 hypothetical protein [Candidatus Obscuribacterales bacterium]